MTSGRYSAYRRVVAELSLLTPCVLDEAERARLQDAAEGMLLARPSGQSELDELRGRVAVSLSVLVGLGRCSNAEADVLWQRLVACGPDDPPAPERVRAPLELVC